MENVNQTRRRLIIGTAAAASGAAIGFPVVARAADPVRIACICGLSGVNSPVAPAVVQSGQLAVAELNAKGGILGRKVELLPIDDSSDASGAVKAFNNAIYQKKVDVIIAYETSAARNAGEPIAARAKMPYIYTSPYEGGACGANLFINGWVPPQVEIPLLKYMINEKGLKSWFAIGSDYAFGRGIIGFAVKTIKSMGGTIVGEQFNPLSSNDWQPIFTKVRGANPAAIVYSTSNGSPNATFMKQYKATGLKVPVASFSIDELTALKIGEPAEGVYYTADYFTSLDNPENAAYLAAMKKMFGAKLLTPSNLSVPEYDAIHIYALAAEKAKSVDAEKIIKTLPTVSFKGPRGLIQMNKEHHAALPIYLAQIQKDGSSKVIKDFGLVDPGNQCPKLA
jgi:branched-chain amino acid transport system substrate-binding protein